MKFEKKDSATGEKFTWSQSESLEELKDPNRILEIKAEHEKKQSQISKKTNLTLGEVFSSSYDDEEDDGGCFICHL